MHIPTLNNEQMKAAGLAYFFVVTCYKGATGETLTRHFDSMDDALEYIRSKGEYLYLYNNFTITALMERA